MYRVLFNILAKGGVGLTQAVLVQYGVCVYVGAVGREEEVNMHKLYMSVGGVSALPFILAGGGGGGGGMCRLSYNCTK